MTCMAVLQNCMGFVEGETGSCSETCVECDVDGTEEVSINVGRYECEVVAALAFRQFIATKGNCEIALHCFVLWIAILKSRVFLEVIAING